MKTTVSVLLLAATLSVGLGSPPAAAADSSNAQLFIARVQSITPQCRDFPNAPFVGRVSGILSGGFGRGGRGVSFVGCFGSLAACQRWLGPISGQITGRLIQNSCRPRRGR